MKSIPRKFESNNLFLFGALLFGMSHLLVAATAVAQPPAPAATEEQELAPEQQEQSTQEDEEDEEDAVEVAPSVNQIGRAMQDMFDRIWVPRSRFTDGPRVREAFRPVVDEVRRATVQVRMDGRRIALGGIVGPDGWVLTKASLARGRLTCRLSDGRELPARVVGVDRENDLAMLKIEATGLPAIELPGEPEQQSKVSLRNNDSSDESQDETATDQNTAPVPTLQPGDWVATVGAGRDPEAIGVVSVMPRRIEKRPGFLGITMDQQAVDEGGVRVLNVSPKSAAAEAGLVSQDVITQVDGIVVNAPAELGETIKSRSPDDVVQITLRRNEQVLTIRATLRGWALNITEHRAFYQNNLGSKLSVRRFGFDQALQHDTVLEPRDCGGPLVDLEGRVVGFNISRAGRTESYALPVSLVRERLYDLMSGHLAPPYDKADAAVSR